MIVTIHDHGSIHGGIEWSNPRTDEHEPMDLDADWPEDRAAIVEAIIEQVQEWRQRPAFKYIYTFQVRETWRI